MPGPWKSKGGLVFEKEALPVGDHVRWISDTNETTVNVELPFLKRIVEQFNKFKEAGVRVPLFKTHKEDPDNERGLVQDLRIKKNKKGILSLFSVVKFHDEEAARKGTKVDVSVCCPPRWKDSKGNKYSYPLRHLALTSNPIVAGLQEFSPIVMSYDTPTGLLMADETGGTMNELIEEILAELEIEAPEGSNEEAKLRLALQAIKNLPVEEIDDEEEEAALNLSHPPVLVREMARSRETIIKGLVSEGVLSPAHGDRWRKKYASKEAINEDLQLSSDDGETEFDTMVEEVRELSKGRELKNSGRKKEVPVDSILMSRDKGDDDEENPLVANAKKRREVIEKKFARR